MLVHGTTSPTTSIGVNECVTGTALTCHGNKLDYIKEIGKGVGNMFFMHGQQYNQQMILNFTESILDTYQYETPETILLFLKKAGNGDFGKFYGTPDIGTIREWFATFLGDFIVPARRRFHELNKEPYDNQREQSKSFKELSVSRIQATTPTYEKRLEKGKGKRI